MAGAGQMKLPDCTSLLTFEAALYQQRWSKRELARLEENTEASPVVDGVRECLGFLNRIVENDARTPQALAQLKFQNMVCVASKACPEEALRWISCIQSASRRGGIPAANALCDDHSRRLERCTHKQASLLVSAALLKDASVIDGHR
jgi:hypothetical protein